jgi:hypothetical protein
MKETSKKQLLFVYNADSSIFGLVTDYVHKVVSPATYQCNLCKITYSNLGMKKEWKDFIQALPVKSIFLHRDELIKKYPETEKAALPAIYIVEDKKAQVLVVAKEINQLKSLKDLMKLVEVKLEKLPSQKK